MPIVIIQKENGSPEIKNIPANDWNTMTTALKWKRGGHWEKIKWFVYRHGLNKAITKPSSKHAPKKKGLLESLIRL